MKILVACEFSGIVRDAFLEKGHDAISCDLLPTERPGPHIQGDVREILSERWDLVIAHPPCTYLCLSGVRWLYEKKGRWELMNQASEFFNDCLRANSPRVAVENPQMHGYAKVRSSDFCIQPWQFGHGEVKRTCFWVKGLSKLHPTNIVSGREARVHRCSSRRHNRWMERSRTYKGIARAMAEQWGRT